jgi:hypothetical protein
MSELILLMCVVSFVMRKTYRVKRTRAITFHVSRFTPLDWSVLALLIVSVISVFLAEYRQFALREFRVIILEPIVYYTLMRAAQLDRRAVWRIVDGLVLAVCSRHHSSTLSTSTSCSWRRVALRSVYGANNVGLLGLYPSAGRGLGGHRQRIFAASLSSRSASGLPQSPRRDLRKPATVDLVINSVAGLAVGYLRYVGRRLPRHPF